MGRGGVGRRAAVLLTLFLLFSVRYGLYFSSSPPLPQFFSLLRIDSFGLLFPSTLFFHSNFFSTRGICRHLASCVARYIPSLFSPSAVSCNFPFSCITLSKILTFPRTHEITANPIPARTHTSRVPVYSPPFFLLTPFLAVSPSFLRPLFFLFPRRKRRRKLN